MRKNRRNNRYRNSESGGRDFSSLKSVSTNVEKKDKDERSSVKKFDRESEERNSFNKNYKKNRFKFKSKNNSDNHQRDNNNSRSSEQIKNDFKRQFIKSDTLKGPYHRVKRYEIDYSREEYIPYKKESLETAVCGICGKPISNMLTALVDNDNGNYAHFDCMFDKITSKVTLKDGERITYIGGGNFAVVEDIKDENNFKFKIKEKFQMAVPKNVK